MKRNRMKTTLLLAAWLLATMAGWASPGEMKTHGAIANGGYSFWIYTPADYDGSQPQPVVVFLHGRSLCGHDLNRVLRYGTLDAIKRGMALPAIVVAPQNPGGAWRPGKLMAILDWLQSAYKVDTTRVYVLGMSLGGYGTMDFCGTYPNKIAAGMALCGGSTLKDVDGLGELPFWIIHGTADRAVGINCSKTVVQDLQAHHKDIRLRFDWLQGATHGALARAFYLKDTYDWLLAHTTRDPGRPVEEYIDINNAILKQAYSELRELSRLVDEDDMSEDPGEVRTPSR